MDKQNILDMIKGQHNRLMVTDDIDEISNCMHWLEIWYLALAKIRCIEINNDFKK